MVQFTALKLDINLGSIVREEIQGKCPEIAQFRGKRKGANKVVNKVKGKMGPFGVQETR